MLFITVFQHFQSVKSLDTWGISGCVFSDRKCIYVPKPDHTASTALSQDMILKIELKRKCKIQNICGLQKHTMPSSILAIGLQPSVAFRTIEH